MTNMGKRSSVENEAERKLRALTAHPDMGHFLRILDSVEISSGFALGYVRSLMDSEELMAGLDRGRILSAMHMLETSSSHSASNMRALAIVVNAIREFTIPGTTQRFDLNRTVLSYLDDQADLCVSSFAAMIAGTFDGREAVLSA
jgi:hypothetical protein